MKKKPFDLFLAFLTYFFTGVTFLVLIFIVAHVLKNGLLHLKPSLFAFKYNSENLSMFPALVTTLITIAASLAISMPAGVFAAIFLVEYARRGNYAVRIVRVTAETLSGIPSIVYGLFGMLFFVSFLRWGFSVLSGSFTLSIMILPLIMRTTEESLKAVPDAYREGSFGLGAGRLRTVFRVVLPGAAPGILAGAILAVGRIVGETAALIYTAGTVAKIPESLFASGRTLAIHMWALSSEGQSRNEAYATAVVLLLTVILINALSARLASVFTKNFSG